MLIPKTYDETADKVSLFKKFAFAVAAAGEFCDLIADEVWEAIKPVRAPAVRYVI